MSVTVRIPPTLRTLTGGAASVEVEGDTVSAVIDALDAVHPGFKGKLLDDAGSLVRFVNVFVDDEDVRFMEGLGTAVAAGGTVSIMAAVAGGA